MFDIRSEKSVRAFTLIELLVVIAIIAILAAMLTLDDGELAGEVAVNLSTVTQSANGWSIAAGLDSAVAVFGVELSTGSASGLRLDDTLDSSYGIYEGWGFTFDEGVLKFKNLAS